VREVTALRLSSYFRRESVLASLTVTNARYVLMLARPRTVCWSLPIIQCSPLLLLLPRSLSPSAAGAIVALNAQYFLETGGHFVISIKANCIDSTVPAEAVFAEGGHEAATRAVQAFRAAHPGAIRERPRSSWQDVARRRRIALLSDLRCNVTV